MKNRIFIPTMILGTLLASGIFVYASSEPEFYGHHDDDAIEYSFGDGERRHDRMEHRLEMMATILDLSESQQEQIETLFNSTYDDSKQARLAQREGRQQLRRMSHGSSFDETAFRALARQLAEQRVELMVERAKLRQQVYALLTPEQQQKADQLIGKMGRHHQRGPKH